MVKIQLSNHTAIDGVMACAYEELVSHQKSSLIQKEDLLSGSLL
jgi:hypothetical protein